MKKDAGAALDGLTMIEAAGERDEAGAIALLMREVVETAGEDRGAGDARPKTGASGGDGASALEDRGR